jgi:hypothetical protein
MDLTGGKVVGVFVRFRCAARQSDSARAQVAKTDQDEDDVHQRGAASRC